MVVYTERQGDVTALSPPEKRSNTRYAVMRKVSKTDGKRLAEMEDKDIDTSDIPELDDTFFQNAEVLVPPKQPVTLRLDADVLTWFKSQGPGYQTRINKLLRRYMESQQSLR
jgi:uncharacterized protein (DUF4415 family)